MLYQKYIDWIRVYATFAVISIHVSATYVANYKGMYFWHVGNFFESISRIAVPLFTMVSGALLLNTSKQLTYSQFFTKRLNKVLIPFVAWSIIYFVYYAFKGTFNFSINDFIVLFLSNKISFHLWFMYMIVGLYLFTPILIKLLSNSTKRDVEYFLLLWIFANFINKFFIYRYQIGIAIDFAYIGGFVGYFILGYYFSKYPISPIIQKLSIYILIFGVIITDLFTYYDSFKDKFKFSSFWYNNFSITTLIICISFFIFFKYIFTQKTNSKLPYWANLINRASFGIYLAHILVMDLLSKVNFRGLTEKTFSVFAIPIQITTILTISLVIVIVLQKIPYLRKIVS